MKRLLLVFFVVGMLTAPLFSQAQSGTSFKPKYLRFPEIPPFAFTAAGGKHFTNKDLKEGRPTMIFLFSVDCSHCQHETKKITENIEKFKGSQILMITPFRYNQMYSYYRGFGIQKYPDVITMGTDSTRRLNMFYQQRYYPGIYIYDKKGKIVYHNEGSISIDTLVHYLKPE